MVNPQALPTAVLRGHHDAYNVGQERLLGRQSAGNGFLRAAIAARGDRPIYGLSPTVIAARNFATIVAAIDPRAPVESISRDQFERVAAIGVYYLSDLSVAEHARLRLRSGVGGFSLCGVTHTTASSDSMDRIVDMLREPVMPWDALVCTTSAVVETIRRVHEAEQDYLRWRYGRDIRLELPQLPIIPLGVHCGDFAFSPDRRAAARIDLGLDPDTVTALFVGRLVYHAKAHPFAMYRGLQAAAERTGKPVALILCGWTPNGAVADNFASGAAEFAPDVKTIFVEGRDPVRRGQAWAAADIFVSLSDSIQETFGLTPIEAMAAGLPVVATDWNGYRDTVRDGIDGFRVRTWAPAAGMGVPIARAYETYGMNYDHYCWATAATSSVNLTDLSDALTRLVDDSSLRRQLGEAGRQRARDVFDWPVLYRRYQELWAELNARRAAANADPEVSSRLAVAPRAGSGRLDPYYAFGHYPSAQITPQTVLATAPGASLATLQATFRHGLFSDLPAPIPQLEALYRLVESGPLTVAAAARRMSAPEVVVGRAAGVLAKAAAIELA